MATNFPASLDTLTNPTSTDSLVTVSHAGQHANANDAIEALQAKVGADNSAVATSLDYRINQLESGPAGSSITVSDTAPVSPSNGDLWFDSTSAATYVYYDSTWVEIGGATIDDPTKIENSIVNAKGDLITATADDTPARLPVGTNGQFLVADSGETTGLKWATAGVFTDFSPSCSWSAYGSFDFVRYAEVNKIVFLKFQFTLTGAPSGTFEFDQPVVEDAGTATVGSSGSAELIDADGSNHPSFCYMTGTVIRIAVGTGGTVNSTTPFTWASGDQIRGLMIYEAD